MSVSVYVRSYNAPQSSSPLPVAHTDDKPATVKLFFFFLFASVVSALPPVSGASLAMELRKRISGLLFLAWLCTPAGRTYLHIHLNNPERNKQKDEINISMLSPGEMLL